MSTRTRDPTHAPLAHPLALALAAFPHAVDYESFWIKQKASEWTRDPLSLVTRLRAMPADEILLRQRNMDKYRADILYDAPPWRMGNHVLNAAAQCARRRLGSRCRAHGGGAPSHTWVNSTAPHALAQPPAISPQHASSAAPAAAAVTAAVAAASVAAPVAAPVVGGSSMGGDGTCDCATRSRSAACDFGRRCELGTRVRPREVAAVASGAKAAGGGNRTARRRSGEPLAGHHRRGGAGAEQGSAASEGELVARVSALQAELHSATAQLQAVRNTAAPPATT